MSDVVGRLRANALYLAPGRHFCFGDPDLLLEAADLIEQLRFQVLTLKARPLEHRTTSRTTKMSDPYRHQNDAIPD